MKIIKKQPVSNNCFVCGINNPVSLKLQFYETEEGEVISSFSINEHYQSYANRLHGGIISTILDEAMARSIKTFEESSFGVTVEIKVKFLKPVQVNQNLKVNARVTNNTKLIFEATSEISEGDFVFATAYGKYMKVPIEDITGVDKPERDWLNTELTCEEIRGFNNKS